MTYKNTILKLLKSNPDRYFFSYELIKVNTPYGWLGISGDRIARELHTDGRLEKVEDGQYVKYKYKYSDAERFHLKMQNQ